MAAFIVISADNRLHYLVDGIEKCRPLNPDVSLAISTGKIIQSESGYKYEYTVCDNRPEEGDAKSLSNLLANQLAAFRKAYTLSKDQLVNIFYLENPLTQEDLEESGSWIEELDSVYGGGQGSDTSFCLFRIVFSYDQTKPWDVETQIDVAVLQQLLEQHRNAASYIQDSSESSFPRYLFYIDNQNSDSAALCLGKEEHDLKMPRFLLDFMMLASNSSDSYNVLSSINSSPTPTRCFSVGFAESMYYYPDVERYYRHADRRDLYGRFLKDDDDAGDDCSKKAMDIAVHPFGLRSRETRLGRCYNDVPYTENIKEHRESSDYKIDSCIQSLRSLIDQKRDEEYKMFCNSPEVKEIEDDIEYINSQIKSAPTEEFAYWRQEKDGREKELENLKSSFNPECPLYIDRNEIYAQLCVAADEDKQDLVEEFAAQYNNLVNFVRSKKFLEFVKAVPPAPVSMPKNDDGSNPGTSQNSGCLSRLFHWHKQKINVATPLSAPVFNPQEQIIAIVNELDLKSKYARFKREVEAVETDFNEEKKYCEDFKLTVHTNHYYPLIDLNQLRREQSMTFLERNDKVISQWKDQKTPTKSSLVELVEKSSTEYTKAHFSFVDWNNPFSFVVDLSNGERLANICNVLQRKASPSVNYNLTADFKENKVVRQLYSDRPDFKKEIEAIQTKLDNGNEISATTSTHIASKISMMQILPMDADVLDNLVDLVGHNQTNVDYPFLPSNIPNSPDDQE